MRAGVDTMHGMMRWRGEAASFGGRFAVCTSGRTPEMLCHGTVCVTADRPM